MEKLTRQEVIDLVVSEFGEIMSISPHVFIAEGCSMFGDLTGGSTPNVKLFGSFTFEGLAALAVEAYHNNEGEKVDVSGRFSDIAPDGTTEEFFVTDFCLRWAEGKMSFDGWRILIR